MDCDIIKQADTPKTPRTWDEWLAAAKDELQLVEARKTVLLNVIAGLERFRQEMPNAQISNS